MGKIFRKLSDHFLYGGLTHDQYEEVTPLIGKNNLKTWRFISLVLTVVFLVSFLSSLNVDEIATNKIFYILMLVVSAVVTVLLFFVVKPQNYKVISFLVYLSYGLILGFSIILGVFSDADFPATTYFVVLVAIPMVICGRPWIANTESFVSIVVFCILVGFYKTSYARNLDIYNACLFGAMSIVMHFVKDKSSLKGFYAELLLQRDLVTDALTGLENELAYVRMAESTDMEIAKGMSPKFATVMMDLNGIKPTNDKYGHMYGCALIVEAGHYVKQRFPNSRCFHVGGDEYIVKLLGDDYENRDHIFREFNDQMDDYFIEKEGIRLRVSLAYGVSCYQKGKDFRWRDVMIRADKAMYIKKAEMKKKYNIASRSEEI